MKKLFFHFFGFFIIFFSYSFQLNAQSNQQLDLKDFVVFSFKNLNFEKKSKINSTGNIGSKKSIDLDKESVIKANLFSFETISFDKDNKITGNVYAYNNANDLNKKILDGKKDSKFTGDLFINGKIDIHKDSKITGSVRQPIGASYKGPTPTGGITNGPIVFSPMPNIPVVNGFSAGTNNISGNQTILPGTYGELKLNNEETLTLNGPGTYIFKSIENKGKKTVKIKFDFKNSTTGKFRIFVVETIDLKSIKCLMLNGGTPARIYTEVHATGNGNQKVGFSLDGGKSDNNTNWLGTIWVPFSDVDLRASDDENKTVINGALWAGGDIKIRENVKVIHTALEIDPNNVSPYYPPPAAGKTPDLIGSELTSISTNTGAITSIPNNNIFQIENNTNVTIEVVTQPGQLSALIAYLQSQGMTNIVQSPTNPLIVTGSFPISNLLNLNTREDLLRFSRPLYEPLTKSGLTTTQGDVVLKTNLTRSGFNVSGDGIKIGVISDSYNTIPNNPAQTDIVNGDLPGAGNPNGNLTPIQVLLDFPKQRTDEGRAMLQIIHDIAPKSSLAFRTGFNNPGDFAEGILELAAAGCKVIVDDITYITEPFFKDGVVAKAVDQVTILVLLIFLLL